MVRDPLGPVSICLSRAPKKMQVGRWEAGCEKQGDWNGRGNGSGDGNADSFGPK